MLKTELTRRKRTFKGSVMTKQTFSDKDAKAVLFASLTFLFDLISNLGVLLMSPNLIAVHKILPHDICRRGHRRHGVKEV